MLRAAFTLCLALPALSQTRVAVVATPAGDGVGPEVAATVDSALAARLKKAGHTVLSSADVASRIKRHPELRGCTRAECLDRVAEIVQAARLAGGAVRREGTTLSVQVWVYDPAVHASVTGQSQCKSCGFDRTAELAASALDQALARDSRRFQPVMLSVGSQPVGATVRLDGRLAGVTPLRVRLSPGSHEVSVSMDGFEAQTRDLEAEGGVDLDLHFPLAPSSSGPRFAPALKWLALGGAIVAVTAGAVLFADDGGGVGGGAGPIEGQEVRASRPEGVVLIGVGFVLGATGVTLWWLE